MLGDVGLAFPFMSPVEVYSRPDRAGWVVFPLITLAVTVGGVALVIVVGQHSSTRSFVGLCLLSVLGWLTPFLLLGVLLRVAPYGTARPVLSPRRVLVYRVLLSLVALVMPFVGYVGRHSAFVGLPLFLSIGGSSAGVLLHGARQFRLSRPTPKIT